MADFAQSSYGETAEGILRTEADAKPNLSYVVDAYIAMAPAIDSIAPVVALVSPLDGSVAANEAIVIDVTDNEGDFARILVAARFPSLGVTELVHDGGVFVDRYTASSTRTLIAGGWRYSLRRSGGWPAGPIIRAWAIDGAGNPES